MRRELTTMEQALQAEANRIRALDSRAADVMEGALHTFRAAVQSMDLDMYTLRDEVRMRFIVAALAGAATAGGNPEHAAAHATEIADATLVELGLRATAGKFTKKETE